MAKPKTPAKTETAPVTETPAPVEETAKPKFSWDDLPAIATPTYTRNEGPSTIDVEADTPEVIKTRLTEAFEIYTRLAKAAADGSGVKNFVPKAWRMQDCGSPERAKEFMRLLKRYGKNRKDGRVTVRAGINAPEPNVVRFMVKPFEARDKQD